VGFWLNALGRDLPDRVERTHLYYRLERLVPEIREVILSAGAGSEPAQPDALEQLIELLTSRIDAVLRDLATVDGLRAAIDKGRLRDGLVKSQARDYLAG
jgi:hypothetical protein